MNKIITLFLLQCSFTVFAQQAGSSGELLKNQATTRELQQRPVAPQNRETTNRPEVRYNNNSNDRVSGRNQPKYSWHQNYGYAEVFVRIPEGGYYTVEIEDQALSSATGKYRFFDLNSGNLQLAIYENNYLIYRTQLNVRNNTRLVLDFFSDYGLYLLDAYPVKGQNYGVNEWDDLWNNSYHNSAPVVIKKDRVMEKFSFDNFIKQLKRSSFDKDKLAFVEQQTKTTDFTAQQIKTILSVFDFDDARLKAGKRLYDLCVDPSEFFIVYETFTFDRNKKELMNFVSNRR